MGLNWYLNPQVTIMLNYIHGWRDSDTLNRDGEVNTFAVRFRWFF
jgi:phosphate-selective porin